MTRALPGSLEMLVLLALRSLNKATAPDVVDAIRRRTNLRFSRGTIFNVMQRLEGKRWLRSSFTKARAIQGGKSRRAFESTATGRSAIRRATLALARMAL